MKCLISGVARLQVEYSTNSEGRISDKHTTPTFSFMKYKFSQDCASLGARLTFPMQALSPQQCMIPYKYGESLGSGGIQAATRLATLRHARSQQKSPFIRGATMSCPNCSYNNAVTDTLLTPGAQRYNLRPPQPVHQAIKRLARAHHLPGEDPTCPRCRCDGVGRT